MLGERAHPTDNMKKVTRNVLNTALLAFVILTMPTRNYAQDPPPPPRIGQPQAGAGEA